MSSEVENRLKIFANMVLRYGRSLTSHDSFEELWILSIMDSVMGWVYIKKFQDSADIVYDVGSGAGFPAVVVAIIDPNVKVIAIDKKKKSVVFMEMVKDRLGLHNLEPVHGDAYKLLRNTKKGGMIISRAVAPISEFVSMLPDDLKLPLFLWKGPRWKEELKGTHMWYPFFEANYELKMKDEVRLRYIVGLERR